MVPVIARRKAGLCEQMPNSRAMSSGEAQMRVGKQLWAAKKPNQKQAECQPQRELTCSFSWGSDERGFGVDEDDDDE